MRPSYKITLCYIVFLVCQHLYYKALNEIALVQCYSMTTQGMAQCVDARKDYYIVSYTSTKNITALFLYLHMVILCVWNFDN